MIDPKELRIGNWVMKENTYLLPSNDNYYSYIKIERGLQIDDYAHICLPISLSPEILEACGFVNTPTKNYPHSYEKNDSDLADDWTFRIWWWGEDICIEPFGRDHGHISIKYLHQLQNIFFALTGKELELKLPALSV